MPCLHEHRVVARQSLRPKPCQRIDHHDLAERDLILDDNMDGRMKLHTRDANTTPTMVGLDKCDALGLVARQPLGR